MLDQGQFYPAQPIQFMDGLLQPIIGGWLAGFPQVLQRLTGSTNTRTTSFTANFSAATAGSILVIEMAVERNNAGPTGAPSGWTAGILNADDTATQRTSVFYKTASGGETSVTVTFGNNEWAWLFREVSGASSITFGTSAIGNSANPDPPLVNPGSAKDYLWIAGAGFGTTSVNSYPSGYSNGTTSASTGVNPRRVASAEKQVNASSEDAGTFTLAASSRWTGFAYGLAP